MHPAAVVRAGRSNNRGQCGPSAMRAVSALCLLLLGSLLVPGSGTPVLDERARARVEKSAAGTASVDFIGKLAFPSPPTATRIDACVYARADASSCVRVVLECAVLVRAHLPRNSPGVCVPAPAPSHVVTAASPAVPATSSGLTGRARRSGWRRRGSAVPVANSERGRSREADGDGNSCRHYLC